MNKLISIIVPVYNVEQYIEQCIKSIQNQTYRNIEIILVDDGSTDKSLQICQELAKEDSRIYVIHQENAGSTIARNTGLLSSKGDYIGFVDSDDWIDDTMYEELLEACVGNEADVSMGLSIHEYDTYVYPNKLTIPAGVYKNHDGSHAVTKNLIYQQEGSGKGFSQHLYDKLFERNLLMKYQLNVDERTKYAEDDVCVYSCLINANKVVVLDRPFYHYRMREGSLCNSHDETYFGRITLFYQQMKKVFELHEDSEILLPQLKRYMLELVLWGINKIFGFRDKAIIPTYCPTDRIVTAIKDKKIILYGAGKVGQDYDKIFSLFMHQEVVLWIDKQCENYRTQGYKVNGIEDIGKVSYDSILIAVDNLNLAQKIKKDLLEQGILEDKILYEKPELLIQKL